MIGHPALALDDVVSITLSAQNDSGQSGSATLLPEGKQTKGVIELSNAPAGFAQPAPTHLRRCDKLDEAPKWPPEAVRCGRSGTALSLALPDPE